MAAALIAVGICASLVMGSNDVANATGTLLLVHLFSTHTEPERSAAPVCSWARSPRGRRILDRVAFDVVKLDLAMASAAQGVQALVVILAVSQGFFTSMNQALIADMAGTGIAGGHQTVNRPRLIGNLRAWLIGPAVGFALAYATETIVR